ncbi:MAG TPA: signal peptidase I [Symbiobacteriaceae bacterium]|nr:signal peptidase I [Symbiobacteriaceae bacterium]
MKSRLINILTWLLVAGSVAILLGGLLGRPVLVAAVPTTSMVPVLRPGDLIPVLPDWGAAPEIGQIIVFKTSQDPSWIVHRVIDGDSTKGYVTKGDANPVPDQHRVFIKDIAGFVPTVGGRALHVPGLGSLSLGRTPLGHPLFAGVALVVGVFLLVNDIGSELFRVRWRRRLRRWGSKKRESNDALFIYGILAVLVFVSTFITTHSLSTEQTVRFSVVRSKSTNVQDSRLTIFGAPSSEAVTLDNPSYLPVIVGLGSNDPDIVWEPSWVFIGPKSKMSVQLTRKNQVLGEHTAKLRQAIYLPVLPTSLIRMLASISWSLPLYVIALIPVLLVLGASLFDRRARLHWQHLRLAFHLRFWT